MTFFFQVEDHIIVVGMGSRVTWKAQLIHLVKDLIELGSKVEMYDIIDPDIDVDYRD